MYMAGGEPHLEDEPLDVDAQGTRAITVAGVVTVEQLTLSSPRIEGVVLRYGHLYGPSTGIEAAGEAPSLQVDAAASAAFLAIEKARRGIYNIANPTAIFPPTRRVVNSVLTRPFVRRLVRAALAPTRTVSEL
jgi:hypothetical protein